MREFRGLNDKSVADLSFIERRNFEDEGSYLIRLDQLKANLDMCVYNNTHGRMSLLRIIQSNQLYWMKMYGTNSIGGGVGMYFGV